MSSFSPFPCPGCEAEDSEPLLTVARAPFSCGQLFATQEAAVQAGQCRLEITQCRSCGHIWNSAYDSAAAALYNQDYYSSFTASSQGRWHQDALSDDLNKVLGLAGKTVLEVGCGDGYFLKSLSSFGARSIGYEPSATFQVAQRQEGIEVYQEHFCFDAPPEAATQVDVVVMRHVLEHLAAPRKALESLRSGGAGPRFLFLEVPNVLQLMQDNLYFDFYNDHVQYFSSGSLERLCHSAGWLPKTVIASEAEFVRLVCVNVDTLDAGPPYPDNQVVPAESGGIESAAATFRRDFQTWRDGLAVLLTGYRGAGKRIAVWGAGARGVALLAGLDMPEGTYDYVVDSDSNKHGRHLPVICQSVSSPERLREDPVDCVLVTSYTYFDEIAAELQWFRTKGGKIIKVYPTPVVV